MNKIRINVIDEDIYYEKLDNGIDGAGIAPNVRILNIKIVFHRVIFVLK